MQSDYFGDTIKKKREDACTCAVVQNAMGTLQTRLLCRNDAFEGMRAW
jgi:hypothetical protein